MKPSQRKIEVKREWLAIKKSESGRANINEIETKLQIKYNPGTISFVFWEL